MFITYSPDGDPPREWDIDVEDLLEEDAERIERQFRKTTGEPSASFDQFRLMLLSGGAAARRVLLWYLLRQEHPVLRYEDTPNIRRKQLKVEWSKGEYKLMLERAMEQPESSDRDQGIELLRREIATARDSLADDESGKA